METTNLFLIPTIVAFMAVGVGALFLKMVGRPKEKRSWEPTKHYNDNHLNN